MATYKNVFQYSFKELQESPFPLKGKWGEKYFKTTILLYLNWDVEKVSIR